jgi:hypothetical protein
MTLAWPLVQPGWRSLLMAGACIVTITAVANRAFP